MVHNVKRAERLRFSSSESDRWSDDHVLVKGTPASSSRWSTLYQSGWPEEEKNADKNVVSAGRAKVDFINIIWLKNIKR